MNFTILGCGRWGSFIAWYLNTNNNSVTVWGREGHQIVEDLIKTRQNEYVEFPESIEITKDLEYALSKSEHIIISISSQALRDLMSNVSKIEGFKDKKYILCMKGIEETTGSRLSSILIEFGVVSDVSTKIESLFNNVISSPAYAIISIANLPLTPDGDLIEFVSTVEDSTISSLLLFLYVNFTL